MSSTLGSELLIVWLCHDRLAHWRAGCANKPQGALHVKARGQIHMPAHLTDGQTNAEVGRQKVLGEVHVSTQLVPHVRRGQ